MATTSRWRERASAVIREVLASLPPGAPNSAKRKACNACYPFGQRANRPYKIWLSELKRQIPEKPKQERPVRLRFTLIGDRFFHAYVQCDYCPSKEINGCLMCRLHQERLRALLVDQDFHRLRRSMQPDDHADCLIFADWLDEHGYDELAEQLREKHGTTP